MQYSLSLSFLQPSPSQSLDSGNSSYPPSACARAGRRGQLCTGSPREGSEQLDKGMFFGFGWHYTLTDYQLPELG